MRSIVLAVAAALAAPAAADDGREAAVAAVSHFMAACFVTATEPERVAAFAAKEGYSPTDQASTGQLGIGTGKFWTAKKNGLQLLLAQSEDGSCSLRVRRVAGSNVQALLASGLMVLGVQSGHPVQLATERTEKRPLGEYRVATWMVDIPRKLKIDAATSEDENVDFQAILTASSRN